ncbi:hypothetical protein OIV54_11625 [Burkholderia pseudomallei]|uniref:hypothetical protein n=1 Tax=Burkholderia pseudomallei TaxID=28450 RepID=UPI000B1BC247|nr:hypothetical protein [Burkholderia pseudomallei]MCW0094798.1 hypothetical protein [Burkholderia pseudomallei]MDS1028128.1 hypothetical protein [Burkholderia pseudomallei]
MPLVLLSRREHAAKARGAPAIGGDWWRASAGIGGHWRALVGAVAAGISARFADALFDMHVGLGALHSSGVRVLLADEPTSRRADEPTSRRADEPTSRRADEPTSRRADEPMSRHADGSTVPSVYESIPVSPMQSRRLADSPIYRFASACRAAVPRPSGAERSIIGSRIHTTPTRRPPAVARPFEAARRRRHIRRASRPTAVHSLEAHRRRKP